jgi:hypothetical protein
VTASLRTSGARRAPGTRAHPRRCWWLLAALLPVLLVVGASSLGTGQGPSRAQPWADRPVVALRFDVAEDLRSAVGRERVLFTPDLPVCELVFRSHANKPATARPGSGTQVTEVRVDGVAVDAQDVAAGAPEGALAGTLLEVPLPECVEAGRQLTVELDFDLVLGEDVDERVGTSSTGEVAWFATAFPLLSWERGRGWERGPVVGVTGETVVSEDFRLDALEVEAPARFAVLGTGTRTGGPEATGDGTAVHRFTAPAVRDVAVSVGDLDVVEREIDGVRVHLALDNGVEHSEAEDWFDDIATGNERLVDLLGPFPYEDLWVTVLSAQTSGIEFPGALQFGDTEDDDQRSALVTHELAHMWFYGLVGNDQGEHPWLDESFATFAQLLVDGRHADTDDLPDRLRGRVGEPMSFFSEEYRRPSSSYVEAVYTGGGAALLEARRRAGPDEFDAALRDYLDANAYSVATPQDVEDAFADLPEVLEVLHDVGALPSP